MAARPELFAGRTHPLLFGKEATSHLRWMHHKDRALGQDMFLIGASGPLRRWLAMHYCAVARREVEYVALTRDTTESDLKQRREIVDGGTLVYVDQAAVRAALHGRVLVLDGIENAERNVLPVLNNLLENREMALEDGRFLMAPDRFDKETARAGGRPPPGIARVHPDFRVIAIGLPVPPFPGNPLDPPLRSRFQARRVDPLRPSELAGPLRLVAPAADAAALGRIVAFSQALQEMATSAAAPPGAGGSSSGGPGDRQQAVALHQLLPLPESGLMSVARTLALFPLMASRPAVLLRRVYPWRMAVSNGDVRRRVEVLAARVCGQDTSDLPGRGRLPYTLHDCGADGRLSFAAVGYGGHGSSEYGGDDDDDDGSAAAAAHVPAAASSSSAPLVTVRVPAGGGAAAPPAAYLDPYQRRLLVALLQSHAAGRDSCIVGGKGEGKSHVAWEMSRALGYGGARTRVMVRPLCFAPPRGLCRLSNPPPARPPARHSSSTRTCPRETSSSGAPPRRTGARCG